MEHPAVKVARVTRFLDSLIQEHGDQLFVGFVFLSLVVLIWIFVRRRKRPVRDFPVVILPLGRAPIREVEPEPPPFEERHEE
jgi:hypothetical protein